MKRSIQLFSGRLELFFIGVPLLFLVFVPFEIFFATNLDTTLSQTYRSMLLNTIFMNVTHVGITYMMLFMIPEMKEWILQISKGNPTRFWVKLAFIFSLLFGIFYYMYSGISGGVGQVFFFFLIGVLPIHHAIYQIKGLSSAYSHKIKNSLRDNIDEHKINYSVLNLKEKLNKKISTEIILFHLFFASTFLFRLIVFLLEKHPDKMPTISMQTWRYGFLTVDLLIIAIIFYHTLKVNRIVPSTKPFFLLRLVSFPLAHFSTLAGAASIALHGTEYYCVGSKMNTNSSSGEDAKRKFQISAVLMLILFGILYFYVKTEKSNYEINMSKMPPWLLSLNAVITALIYLHYYLDRIIFRMRNAENRNLIAPLLN